VHHVGIFSKVIACLPFFN